MNRIRQTAKAVRNMTDGLHRDDIREILRQVGNSVMPEGEPEPEMTADPEDMQKRILKAIQGGLDSDDAQMVRAAMEWQQDHAGREYLRELVVNITPYTIADKSLYAIVLDAGDDIIAQIETGLVERAERRQHAVD